LSADPRHFIPKEIPMRMLASAVLAISAFAASVPAQAQTYDPSYPVCMHVVGRINYYDCRFTSLAQCNVSAGGRAAQCEVNPYYGGNAVAARKRTRVY
jgi:hypothetical protein